MNKKIKNIIITILLVGLLGGLMAGCTSTTPVGENTNNTAVETKVDKIQKAGKVIVGTSADYPPYEFHKVINGKPEIVGFDIEIAKEIAKDLGVELEIKDMKFDGLLAALVAGNIDFIIAGMVPTEERKKSVDFSVPYYEAEQTILIRTKDADKIKTIEDLKGLKIGAQKSTVQEEIAINIDGAEVKSLAKITDLALELKNNKIDGIVMVATVASAYAKKNEDLMIPNISFGKEDGVAVAVSKNNEEFLASINKTFERLMAADKITEFINEATILAEEE